MIQWSNVNLAEIVSNALPDVDCHVSGWRTRRLLAKYESDRNGSPDAHRGAQDCSDPIQYHSPEY